MNVSLNRYDRIYHRSNSIASHSTGSLSFLGLRKAHFGAGWRLRSREKAVSSDLFLRRLFGMVEALHSLPAGTVLSAQFVSAKFA